MRTERQIQAARENGRKSRGPATPEGKAISSRNAYKHGLCAKSLLLDRESPVRFHAVVTGLYREFSPETPAETAAVEAMAFARWRQMRLWSLEKCTLNDALRGPATAFDDASAPEPDICTRTAQAWVSLGDRSNALGLFARYENLYERQFTRAHRLLREIRAARKMQNEERTREIVENTASDSETEPGTNRL